MIKFSWLVTIGCIQESANSCMCTFNLIVAYTSNHFVHSFVAIKLCIFNIFTSKIKSNQIITMLDNY